MTVRVLRNQNFAQATKEVVVMCTNQIVFQGFPCLACRQYCMLPFFLGYLQLLEKIDRNLK